MIRITLVALLFASSITGCSSIKTTPLTRHENEELTIDPKSPLKGIPVMLRVPSHLELEIVETSYYEVEAGSIKKDGERPILKAIGSDLSLNNSQMADRDVIAKLQHTEKMFTVDPKRVFSGTGLYGFGFDQTNDGKFDETRAGKGYLSSLDYTAVDTTITDSAAFLNSVLPMLGKKTANEQAKALKQNLVSTQRTVAYRRFDLASPTFQEDVMGFLETNLHWRAIPSKTHPIPANVNTAPTNTSSGTL